MFISDPDHYELAVMRSPPWRGTARRLLSHALTLTLAGCAGCEPRYTWESLGPFEWSGAIRHLVIDPTNANRLYAGAENGGLWVLDDVTHADRGWRPLTDTLQNLQMRGIAVSPVDSNYLVTANALGFVYSSRDGGHGWSKIVGTSFQYVRRVLISEGLTRIPAGNYTRLANETIIWVAGQAGLWRIRLVNKVFDSMEQRFPVDTGQGSDVLDAVMDPNATGTLYVGVRGSGVWKTVNQGESWQPSARWAALGDAATQMIRLAINPRRVVAKLGRNLLVNDSGGDSTAWRRTATSPCDTADTGGSDIGYRGNYSGLGGEWTHAVAIHPASADTIAVGQSSLCLSTDGGKTWAAVSSGHEDMQSLAFSPTRPVLYIANDGGVFERPISAAGGTTSRNTRLTTIQFYRVGVNGSVAVGDADHNGIIGTRDFTASPIRWERATPTGNAFGNNSLENDFVSADPHTPGRFFIAFQDTFLLRLRFPPTASTAQDLLPIDAPATPSQPYIRRTTNNAITNQLNYPVGTVAYDPRPASNVVLTAAHEQRNTTFSIQLTRGANANPTGTATNCGDTNLNTFCFTGLANTATWTTSLGPINVPIVSIAFSPTEPRRAYALGERGAIFIKRDVDDAVAPWDSIGSIAIGPPNFARQLMPDIARPGRLYAITQREFLVSSDSGRTWARQGQGSLPAVRFNSLASHPTKSKVLYLATETGVLASGNGGLHWKPIDATLPNAPVMQLFTDSTSLYAVTFGRGFWRAALPR